MLSPHHFTSISQLQEFAHHLLESGYRTFLLHGELGIGKTQFVKELVASLGGDKHNVQSPTYGYINSYSTPGGTVLHGDFYRLESQEEAFLKGIFDQIDSHDIVCIEWPKWMEGYKGVQSISLQFSFHNPEVRQVVFFPYV